MFSVNFVCFGMTCFLTWTREKCMMLFVLQHNMVLAHYLALWPMVSCLASPVIVKDSGKLQPDQAFFHGIFSIKAQLLETAFSIIGKLYITVKYTVLTFYITVIFEESERNSFIRIYPLVSKKCVQIYPGKSHIRKYPKHLASWLTSN